MDFYLDINFFREGGGKRVEDMVVYRSYICSCCSLHKRVPRFFFAMLIFIGMNNVELRNGGGTTENYHFNRILLDILSLLLKQPISSFVLCFS